MKRIFPAYTYGPGPRDGCWWDETCPSPEWPELNGDQRVDVAIIGGGFTGTSAALLLANAGASVAVLEAETPGWGASGRNGGFCCLGGSKLSHSALERRFGQDGAAAYEQAEHDAVALVAALLEEYQIATDTHSVGETQLAHSSRAMEKLRRSADQNGTLHEQKDLLGLGLNGPFFGGYTTPVGFGLNPRKYLFGLAQSAAELGAVSYQNSPVQTVEKTSSGLELELPKGRVQAEQVLICTNGYSSEDVPDWMSARYMPAQSTVLVTRPLTEPEKAAQGWTSDQMCYDTRHLLHYFRLMPDGRFLFGMRGGLRSSEASEKAIRDLVRRDFRRMFPAWSEVEITHIWSGMVCLSRSLLPYAGTIPGYPGMFAGFAFHGNGVAMGSYCGRALARLALGQATGLPEPMTQTPARFPLGRMRRALLLPAYAAMAVADW